MRYGGLKLVKPRNYSRERGLPQFEGGGGSGGGVTMVAAPRTLRAFLPPADTPFSRKREKGVGPILTWSTVAPNQWHRLSGTE
jgi:hypothetical protein